MASRKVQIIGRDLKVTRPNLITMVMSATQQKGKKGPTFSHLLERTTNFPPLPLHLAPTTHFSTTPSPPPTGSAVRPVPFHKDPLHALHRHHMTHSMYPYRHHPTELHYCTSTLQCKDPYPGPQPQEESQPQFWSQPQSWFQPHPPANSTAPVELSPPGF